MTKDEIIRMAHEVFDVQTDSRERTTFSGDSYAIEAFAALVASAEREACAGIVVNEAFQYASPVWAFEIVNDIKERGQA